MNSELFYLTATEASALIDSRKLSPVELTQALLDRIDDVNDQVQAYLLVTGEQALIKAREAERAVMAGRRKGPLHGIPFAVKDNYYTRGIRTCAGSRLMLDHVPDHDAAVIETLDAAGAVLLGKLNTWEYGTGTGSVHFDLPYPPARNPWSLDRFTGGSSTGSGASVAAGMATFAMGTDTGGSVRLPAAACGLHGLKPTNGRISRHGILPNCFTLDVPGALTWSVHDSALVLQSVAGFDARDPGSAPNAVGDYLRDIDAGVRGLRIGVIRDMGTQGSDDVDAANITGMEDMLRVLKEQGAELVELALPVPAKDFRKMSSVINWTESFSIHEQDFIRAADQMGLALRDKMMSGFMTRGADYVAAQRRRRELTLQLNALFDGVDALVLPCAFHVAPAFDKPDQVKAFTADTACTPFSASGHPAMSTCTGFDADGLPTNVQVVGRWFDEATVLRIARSYERASDWRRFRPRLEQAATAGKAAA